MSWKNFFIALFFAPLWLGLIAILGGFGLVGINFLMNASWTDIAYALCIFWSSLCIAVLIFLGAANQ